MNIPTGKPVIKGMALKSLNYQNMIQDLITKRFNGYVCLTVQDKFGYEDSFIVFEDGIISGAFHSFLDKSKEDFGDIAIKLFMSCFASGIGTLDVFALTKEQAELILTFNEKIKTNPIKEVKYLNQFVNSKYRESFFDSNNNVETNKYDLFKSIGLGNINV